MAGRSRNEQVASLMRVVPSAANRSPSDNAIFDVGIRLSDQKILTLRTELPPQFPRVPPILRILDPGATHPWLDSSGRVADIAELYNWEERSSDLGQVVQKALTEFCTRPPHINPALIAAQKVQNNWVQTLPTPPQQTTSSSAENSQIIQLTVPNAFPELETLDQKSLQELMENDAAFIKFFESLSVVSNAMQLRDSVRTGNVEKATENITLGRDITAHQSSIDSLNQQVADARNRYSRLTTEQKMVESPLEPRKLAEEFETLARQSDEISEEAAMHIFDDAANVDSNLARFRALRVQYHLRKATADRCRAQFAS
jgi:hypothetical protein